MKRVLARGQRKFLDEEQGPIYGAVGQGPPEGKSFRFFC